MKNIDLCSSFSIFDSAIKRVIFRYRDMGCYDDLYQECYMKILDVLQNNTYDPVYNLYGYAYSIARNAVSSFLYHNKKLVAIDDEIIVQQSDSSVDLDFNLYLDEAVDSVYLQYENILGFRDRTYIRNLLSVDVNSLLDSVLKGELIWKLDNYRKQKN
jgi:DNA-directed RNA polymerase specialized sigma24 family protein